MRWSMDFVSNWTRYGLKISALTVINEVMRECLALEVDRSITGQRTAATLSRIALFRGLSKEFLIDNGLEFTQNAMNLWGYDSRVEHIVTGPGKPTQNGYIESFNGKFRMEYPNHHRFKIFSKQEKSLRTGGWHTIESATFVP